MYNNAIGRTYKSADNGTFALQSSENRGWKDIEAVVMTQREPGTRTSTSSSLRILRLSDDCNVTCAISGRTRKGTLSSRMLAITAPDDAAEFSYDRPASALQVSLSSSVVEGARQQIFQRTGRRVAIESVFCFENEALGYLLSYVNNALFDIHDNEALINGWFARSLAAHVVRHYLNGQQNDSVVQPKQIDEKIQLVTAFIRDNLNGDLSIERLANLANQSRAVFITQFKNAMQLPPHQFIMSERIKHAKQMLIGTSSNIKHVAEECGFVDSAHFSSAFKNMVGVPPSTFRSGSRY